MSNILFEDCVIGTFEVGLSGIFIAPKKGYYKYMIKNKHHLVYLLKGERIRSYPESEMYLIQDPEKMHIKEITYPGVSYERTKIANKKWRARVTHEGRSYFVGRFKTQQEAIDAHGRAKEKILKRSENIAMM